MANFPTSPSTGDFFTTNGATYEYTGNAWTVVGPDAGVRISSVQEISATASAPVEEIVGVKSITLQSGSVNAETDVGKLFIEDNGADSYTKLLLHFDGADEATSTTDSSDSGHTITMTGAKIDNGASVFGTSSAYFDGSNDHIDVAKSSDFDFGTAAWTVEMWVYWENGTNTYEHIWAWGHNPTGYHLDSVHIVATDTQKLEVLQYSYPENNSGGPNTNLNTSNNTFLQDQWNHLAVVYDGTNLKIYVNGTQIATTAVSLTSIDYSSQSSRMTIGARYFPALGGTGYDSHFKGYIDEFRISKGIARYTSNFDPPTKQFGRPDLKIKDTYGSYNIKLKQIN